MAVWSEIHLSEIELSRCDAEFYRPEYLTARKIAGNKPLKSFGVTVIHPAEFARKYQEDGLLILLAQNNRSNCYDWSVERFASKQLSTLLGRNQLEYGDVTITRTGANFGQSSVISDELSEKDVFACADLLVLRPQGIDGHLISTYFNTTIGRRLLDRGAYGAAQPHLAPKYIYEIPFPEALISHQEEIKGLICESKCLSKESASEYVQALALLESKLGLDTLSLKKTLNYTTQLSELELSLRADPEYFDPVAANIVNKIREFEHIKLGSSFSVGNGFPWNSKKFRGDNSGEPVVRIRNIRPTHIDIDELTSIEPTYAKKIGAQKAERGDIVVGMDGIKYFYASILEGQCYINQRVAHLHALPDAKVSPEYATFIINSKVGQAQLLRDMTIATTVGHITNRNIAKLVIPYVSDEFHDQITILVRSSIEKKQRSKLLLEQATFRVEQLIEEAVQS